MIDLTSGKKGLGTFKVPRALAQGTYRISDKHKTKIIRNGEIFYRNPTTIVDEKISDTCIQIFQESETAKEFEYGLLRQKAESALKDKFEKYKLIPSEDKTYSENIEIRKKIEIAIHQWIRKYIEDNINLEFEVDFDSFVEKTGVKTAQTRTSYALNMLKDIQSKASYEYKVPILTDDFSEIQYEFKSVAAIPEITLRLDEEMGEKYKTLTEFTEAQINNKKKHIQKLSFKISKSYLSAIIGLGKDYTPMNRKERDKFNSTYSFRLDTLLKSIAKVQHNSSYNCFTFEELQSILGTNISEYRVFKKIVLMKSIEELNKYTEYNVELIETRKSKRISTISFSIKPKIKSNLNLKFNIDRNAYYIASRMFYFSNSKIENLMGFAKQIEKTLDDSPMIVYLDKYIPEWIEEAEREYKIEEELLKFMEDNQRLFDCKNIVYDKKRLCIVEKKTIFIDSNIENQEKGSITLVSSEGESLDKVKLLSTGDYSVTSPSTSLRYIHEVLLKELPKESSVIDFMPFFISTPTGNLLISELEVYAKYRSLIMYNIIEKNLSYFSFEEGSLVKDLFFTKILEGNFREVTSEFREMVKTLTSN